MEGLFLLGLLIVVIGLPILIVTAFIMAYHAQRQVRDLQAQLNRVDAKVDALHGTVAAGRRAAAAAPAAPAAPAVLEPQGPPGPPGPPPIARDIAPPVIAAAPPPSSLTPQAVPVTVAASTAASTAATPAVIAPAPPLTQAPPAMPGAPPDAGHGAGTGTGASFEARFGARLPVWIGAICLALAGVFLVKYAFDNDWLGPTVRVALGVLFGVALLIVGERSFGRTPRIPAALSAAGIAVLYASFLSAGRLYDLVPPIAAFALMALTTAVAIGLSLRQGRLIAVVGLVGGFLTPYLLGPTPDPSPAPLFAYLLLLQVGLLVVTRRRGWYELAGLTLAAGLVWVVAWLAGPFEGGDGRWLGLFLLASTAAFVAAAWGRDADVAWKAPRAARALNWAAMAGGLVLMALVTSTAGFGTLEWVYLGILGAGALVVGRLDRAYVGLPWLAAALTAFLLVQWGLGTYGIPGFPSFPTAQYLGTVLVLGAVFAVGGYAALWGAARPPAWAALSGAAGVAYFLVGYLVFRQQDAAFPWGVTAITMALAYVVAAVPVARRRNALAAPAPSADTVTMDSAIESSGTDAAGEPGVAAAADRITDVETTRDRSTDYRHATEALAALAAAATVFISLAIPLELQQEWITVGWAFEVAALAWLAGALGVPALRWLAWPLIVLVAVRLLVNPFVLDYPIGVWPGLNWLLYGYGLPIIAFALAARECAYAADRRMTVVLEWLAMAMGLTLIGLQVRQYFHPADIGSWTVYLAEWGAVVVAWLLYALGLIWAGRRWAVPSLTLGAQVVTGLALGLGLLTLGVIANPAWTYNAVGATPIFNRLLFAYGVPALLALVVARALALRGDVDRRRIWVVWAAALLFVFIGVTLEVRQLFRGSLLNAGSASLAEQYAYSLTWVLLGIALLAAGIVRGGRFLRYASLAVMLVAVAKVFVYDMSNLSGLYRVFSFFGLGLSLLLLGYVYQRFVFREETP